MITRTKIRKRTIGTHKCAVTIIKNDRSMKNSSKISQALR